MITCRRIKKMVPSFLTGELPGKKQNEVRKHLAGCPACRKEYQEIGALFRGAAEIKKGYELVVRDIDWKGLESEIASRTARGSRQPQNTKMRRPAFFRGAGWRTAAAGLSAGLILGSILTYFFFFSGRDMKAGPEYYAPHGFVERAEMEVARRETLDYLERSRFLLRDFVRSPDEILPESKKAGFSAERARFLLGKKKYINPQLDKFRMAKAKSICDQIEMLLIELLRVSEDLDAEEIRSMRSMIEDRQLVLKIKLVEQDLQKSEEFNEI